MLIILATAAVLVAGMSAGFIALMMRSIKGVPRLKVLLLLDRMLTGGHARRMPKPKLTGPLILFVAWTAIAGINGLGSLGSAEKTWKPYMLDCPLLQGAVLAFQIVAGTGLLACLYSAWLVYQREPGSLRWVQTSLLIGGLLRLIGAWIIVVFGGLPPAMAERLLPQIGFASAVILVFTGAWYVYFLRSKRVREIYAGEAV